MMERDERAATVDDEGVDAVKEEGPTTADIASATMRPARFGAGGRRFRAVSSMSLDVLWKKQTASSPSSCSAWLIHSPKSEKGWRASGIAVTKSRLKTFASLFSAIGRSSTAFSRPNTGRGHARTGVGPFVSRNPP